VTTKTFPDNCMTHLLERVCASYLHSSRANVPM
jgi:hypothetical protein